MLCPSNLAEDGKGALGLHLIYPEPGWASSLHEAKLRWICPPLLRSSKRNSWVSSVQVCKWVDSLAAPFNRIQMSLWSVLGQHRSNFLRRVAGAMHWSAPTPTPSQTDRDWTLADTESSFFGSVFQFIQSVSLSYSSVEVVTLLPANRLFLFFYYYKQIPRYVQFFAQS